MGIARAVPIVIVGRGHGRRGYILTFQGNGWGRSLDSGIEERLAYPVPWQKIPIQ